jgi:mutator protein MutT
MDYLLQLRQLIGHRPILMVGAAILVVDSENRLLMLKRSDSGCWGLPGGATEPGEVVEQAAKRETREEAGIEVDEMTLFNVFSGPALYYKYPNGDEVYNVTIIYLSRSWRGHVTLNEEHTEWNWFPADELPEDVSPPIKPVIEQFKRQFLMEEQTMRVRSAAILIQNNSLALMERHRDGRHYFSFPGGGVDAGETPEQAVVREVREELGVEARVIRLAAEVWFNGNQQFFFLVEQVGGTFGSGAGEEFASDGDPARGTYEPIWMPLEQVTVQNVLPKPVAALVVQSHPAKWSAKAVIIEDLK